MTLTEQWRKGELDKTFYYIKYNDDSIRTDLSIGKANGLDFCNSKEVKEVLAPVPSYEEWQQLHKFLEEFNALDVAKENQRLKELLRECRELFDELNYLNMVEKIDNAIGEKK